MVTRCLLKFAQEIATTTDMARWRKLWALLPEKCPHTDCSATATCREVCGAYAAVQAKCVKRRKA